MTANGYEVLLGVMKTFQNRVWGQRHNAMNVLKILKCTFTRVTCIVCEQYRNKAVKIITGK